MIMVYIVDIPQILLNDFGNDFGDNFFGDDPKPAEAADSNRI